MTGGGLGLDMLLSCSSCAGSGLGLDMSLSCSSCASSGIGWFHGMAVVNEGGMTGAVGWTFAGRVIVTEKGVGMTGGYKKFVDPGPGS